MTPPARIDLSRMHHLYPFRSNFVRHGRLSYHYIDEGAGEPLVMLHGNPTWSFYYRFLISRLSVRYRTVVPDHIGCGLSDKPDLDGYDYQLHSRIEDLEFLINHLRLDRKITLIVHDWGGMIGMAYALRRPEKIARLIIMNTAAFFPPAGKKLPFRLRLMRNLSPFSDVAVRGLNLFAIAAAFMATHKGLPREIKHGLTAPYNSWKHRIAVLRFVKDIPVGPSDASYELVQYIDRHLDRLSHLPMLICWGMRDFVFDKDYLAEWQRRFPQANVVAFSDAGHYVLEDVPEKIHRCIEAFLTQHPVDGEEVV